MNRLCVLSFENENARTLYSTYYLPKVEIKDYNVMIDGENLFDQPINNNLKKYENIRRIATGQGGWLHNWLFVRLFLFQRKSQIDCNRFK